MAYLMPNHVCIYIYIYIYIKYTWLINTFCRKPFKMCLRSLFRTQLNGFKYFYVS